MRKLIIFEEDFESTEIYNIKTVAADMITFIGYEDEDGYLYYYLNFYDEASCCKYYIPDIDTQTVELLIKVISIFMADIYPDQNVLVVNKYLVDNIKKIRDEFGGLDKDGNPVKLNHNFIYKKLFVEE